MKALLVLLLASVGAFGQDGVCPVHSHYGGNLNCLADDGWVLKNSQDKVWAEPIPLKCGKYEYVQHTPAHCENTCNPDSMICTSICREVPESNVCAPIMHEVTEKEWQATVESIRLLTKLIDIQKKQIDIIVKPKYAPPQTDPAR